MSEPWIRVDEEEANPARKEDTGNRISIHVRSSPHEVPDAVRSREISASNVLKIEFRYLSFEPVKTVDLPNGMFAEVGVHSGRLETLNIPLSKLSREATTVEIVSEELRDRAKKTGSRMPNPALDVLRTKAQQLIPSG